MKRLMKSGVIRAVVACALVGVAFTGDAQARAKKKTSLLIPVEPGESLIRPQKKVSVVPALITKKRVPFQEEHAQAVDLALKGQTKRALTILNELAEYAPTMAEKDRVYLSIARTKYQARDNVGAIEAYNKVRKGSASWLEALEERASAAMRLNRPQEALATLKTVLTPLFQDRILSEPYFMTALAQLRVCDYKGVFTTLDLFKTRFRERVKTWESSSGDPVATLRLSEIKHTVQKLNLVEAEVIQRLYMEESGKPSLGAPPAIEKNSNQVSFPVDNKSESKEVWVDEVDDYRVTVKGCPGTGITLKTLQTASAGASQFARPRRDKSGTL